MMGLMVASSGSFFPSDESIGAIGVNGLANDMFEHDVVNKLFDDGDDLNGLLDIFLNNFQLDVLFLTMRCPTQNFNNFTDFLGKK